MTDLLTWFRAALAADERARAPKLGQWTILDEYDGGEEGLTTPRPAFGLLRAIKHLAAAHADRPGYREEWRP